MPVYVADMGSQNPVNFTKFGKSGCVGVIHRVTRSNEHTDPRYQPRREMVRTVTNLKWGGYAFNTGEAVSDQVKRFLGFANFTADESAWLDLERNPGGSGQMTHSMVLEFLDRVDQKLGRCCGLYSGDIIKSMMPHFADVEREELAVHPLWGCEYGPRWRNVDANGHPLPWPKPFLWQYTGDGEGPQPHTFDGLEAGADLSVFDGTADELRAQWALPAIPASPVIA
jgi:lysozyme